MARKPMGKLEMVAAFKERFGINGVQSDAMVGWFFDTIADQVVGGASVAIKGFGAFRPKRQAARNFAHPKTGVVMTSDPKTTLHFAPSETLLERLKDATPPESNRST